MREVAERPLQVWRYRGWCALCRPCRRALAVDAGSQRAALEVALYHWRAEHVRGCAS